eukprot:TRINITY_DN4401_c0_g1_i1.p1 TRINITY_DN4401_c0_g1~~TRINITY_DN4401_c0_g1_i1.p1  ORF type:complete len:553 (+),score=88.61 TRINITY_DN4401_c0_g1_i1:171-1829(+)
MDFISLSPCSIACADQALLLALCGLHRPAHGIAAKCVKSATIEARTRPRLHALLNKALLGICVFGSECEELEDVTTAVKLLLSLYDGRTTGRGRSAIAAKAKPLSEQTMYRVPLNGETWRCHFVVGVLRLLGLVQEVANGGGAGGAGGEAKGNGGGGKKTPASSASSKKAPATSTSRASEQQISAEGDEPSCGRTAYRTALLEALSTYLAPWMRSSSCACASPAGESAPSCACKNAATLVRDLIETFKSEKPLDGGSEHALLSDLRSAVTWLCLLQPFRFDAHAHGSSKEAHSSEDGEVQGSQSTPPLLLPVGEFASPTFVPALSGEGAAPQQSCLRARYECKEGVLAAGKGDTRKAIIHFSQAIAMDPSNAKFFSNRACAYLRLERFHEAISDCTSAIARKPSAKAYARRAIAYHCLGHAEESRADMEQAGKLDKNMEQAGYLCSYEDDSKDAAVAKERLASEYLEFLEHMEQLEPLSEAKDIAIGAKRSKANAAVGLLCMQFQRLRCDWRKFDARPCLSELGEAEAHEWCAALKECSEWTGAETVVDASN